MFKSFNIFTVPIRLHIPWTKYFSKERIHTHKLEIIYSFKKSLQNIYRNLFPHLRHLQNLLAKLYETQLSHPLPSQKK